MNANPAPLVNRLPELVHTIEDYGFAIIPDVINAVPIDSVIEDIERLHVTNAVRRRKNQIFGIRNLVNVVPSTKRLAEDHLIASLAQALAGKDAKVVRSLCFEKSAEANWKVIWHQDVTIAVRSRRNVKGYGPWTSKAGIVHAQAPSSVLEKIIALRIHLDNTDESNGALKVIPGSHQQGRMTRTQIESLTRESKPISCNVARGGVLLMRPLLVHSSSAGARPSHRRVVHLEFAGIDLPGGLEWYGS
jgi:ectoine hydroxylase-related dioxygenase (phytanoyl-CoA dioxygenase family)